MPYPFLDRDLARHAPGGPELHRSPWPCPAPAFIQRGGGQLDAWIEPALLRPLTLTNRGRLLRVVARAGVAGLRPEIAERMAERALDRLDEACPGLDIAIQQETWTASSPGAAIALTAEYEGLAVPVTFVGLGERGKPAETVANEAIDEFLAHAAVADAAVDAHSADQILIPLALTPGQSEYTVSAVTEHLRTNARTIRAFLAREITIDEPADDRPGRVTVV